MNKRAHWIWQGDSAEPNTWMRFRKTVRLEERPAQALMTLAVDSKYWLWVNGQIVVREGQLKRGPTPNDTYCDRVDVAPYLHPGDNLIAILVWYWGVDGSSHLSSGAGGLFVSEDSIRSDGSWKASRHPGYQPSTIKPIRPDTIILSEWDVTYDARLVEPVDWIQPEFDDAGWALAGEHGTEGAAPWGRLAQRPIPFWRESALLPYENAAELGLPRRGGEPIVGRLAANIQVTPWFKLRAPAGRVVKVVIERDWKTTTYTTRDGVQEFEVPAWGNGHYVTYTAPGDVEILDIGYRESAYDTDVAGSFECDDPDLDTLWRKSWRTTLVCMRDSYMDCPDRERSPWPNDAVNMIDQTLYVFDRKSDLMTRKLFAELAGWRTLSGLIWGAVPSGRFRGAYREFYSITLIALGPGVGEYYLQTGDAGIANLYPAMRDYLLNHFTVDSEILLHPRAGWETEWGPGTSNWHDWGDQENLDHRLLDNLIFYYALKTATFLAGEFQDEEARARFGRGIALFQEHFDRLFWKGDHYRSWDYDGAPDDRGNAFAVVTGLAGRSKWSDIGRVLTSNQFASVYLEKYVIEALYRMGRENDAVGRIKTRFAHELVSNYTTLPEHFGGDSNHGWSGWPAYIAGKYIAGIRPIAPGYTRYEVAPQIGSLRHVSCSVPTVKGDVAVEIEQSDRRLAVELTSPAGTVATVVVPRHPSAAPGAAMSRLAVDGDVVWTAANSGEDDDPVRVNVAPGLRRIVAEYEG